MVVDTFANTPINSEFTRSEIIKFVTSKHGCNPDSVMPSDYCYNRLNKGINYEKHLHLFEYTDAEGNALEADEEITCGAGETVDLYVKVTLRVSPQANLTAAFNLNLTATSKTTAAEA